MKNILYIGNQLSQKGKTITTIETLSNNLRLEGYSVFTVSKKKNKIFRLFDMLYSIIKHKKRTDFVLIDTYSTTNFYYAYLTSQLCRFLKLEYLPVLHGGNLSSRLKKNPKLSQSIFNNASKNIAPSLFMMSIFESFNYANLFHIPNFIEIKKYHFKKRKVEAINLLWVRSFSKIYNPNLAIDLLSKLKQQNVNATLCMVGPDNDGALEKAKSYAKKLNVEVKFTGKLSKKEWVKLSEDYNVFINTTNFDNMPVSVIEAMALGLPIVSTNVGGIPYLIKNGKEGVLVEPNNVNAFIKAIKQLGEQTEETNQMVINARKKVEQFDWEIVKHKWFEILK